MQDNFITHISAPQSVPEAAIMTLKIVTVGCPRFFGILILQEIVAREVSTRFYKFSSSFITNLK